MLYNSLIQQHFDFACCAWYPNLSMSLKNKLRTVQNTYIRFCLEMERRSHIGQYHFEKFNRLPVKNMVDQCIAAMAYYFENNLSPVCMWDIYTLNSSPVIETRWSVDNFVEPNYMKGISRKSIPYLGSKIWNGWDKNIKTSTSTNSFKHVLKSNSWKTRFLLIYFFYIYIYIQWKIKFSKSSNE